MAFYLLIWSRSIKLIRDIYFWRYAQDLTGSSVDNVGVTKEATSIKSLIIPKIS